MNTTGPRYDFTQVDRSQRANDRRRVASTPGLFHRSRVAAKICCGKSSEPMSSTMCKSIRRSAWYGSRAAHSPWAPSTITRKNVRCTASASTVSGFDEHTVTNAEFAQFIAATGDVTVAEQPLDPAQYPQAKPDLLVPGALVFHMTDGPGRQERHQQLVAICPRRVLAAARGPQRHRRAPTSSRGSCRLCRCRGVRVLGRQDLANRSRMGVRRARRSRRR